MTTTTTTSRRVKDKGRTDHRGALDAMFRPRSVAVIGATERAGSVGRTIVQNLLEFPGKLYPVNPTRETVLGREAFPRVGDVGGPVDLAVIATPAITVPAVVQECVAAGVRAAVIVSAGFRECGHGGAALERKVMTAARGGHLRIIGPNCMGFAVPAGRLNATFAGASPRPGGVAFLSQSGALGTAILDWSIEENVGFSAFVSVGSMADVGWADLLDYFGDDPATKAIALYMESVGEPRTFLSAAREVALSKPIIVVKAGRTADAGRAAQSHTGSMTGSDDVFDAALRRVGVLRVDSLGEMFDMVEALSSQPATRGPRLAIVTNAGGPGVLATDALIAAGGRLAQLAKPTLAKLDGILPDAWSRANPVDVLGDATPDVFVEAIDIVRKDDGCDGVLTILTPQAMSDPTGTAERVAALAGSAAKPILASWMGGSSVAKADATLRSAGIPTFRYPDDAARAFQFMWRHTTAVRSLYETPGVDAGKTGSQPDAGTAVIDAAIRAGRTMLTEHETKTLLAAHGIKCAETRVACDEEQAIHAAEQVGYPVVLKVHSESVTHKSDVRGVKLDLRDAEGVRAAYHALDANARFKKDGREHVAVTVQPMINSADGIELILGSSTDPQFGPVLLFGLGGRLVEVVHDKALGLPPLTTTLARRLMEQTKVFAPLRSGLRGGEPADLEAMERLVVRFGNLVVEQPAIKEIEINPLLVRGSQLVALDARAVLHDPKVRPDKLPRPAIRPYPRQYVWDFTARDGTPVTIRPIRPDDEPLMVRFHQTLSEETVRCRYGGLVKFDVRVAHERLTRLCFIDYDRQIALVSDRATGEGGREILAVGRLIRAHGADEAEFAVVVADAWQNKGLGSKLLELLVHVATAERMRQVTGQILGDAHVMSRLAERAGFQLTRSEGADDWQAEMTL